MATENHWLRSNIKERLTNSSTEFAVTHAQPNSNTTSFHHASQQVVDKIISKYNNVFIPLSGGMDSEYVFNCFLGHKITPIIIDSPANKKESAYAFRLCQETGIKPVIIKKTEKEIIKTYYEQIYKKLHGSRGINSVATYIAGKYADENNGVAVIAEHGFDGMYEWDFYNDALIHEENSIYFFMYDINIFSSMLKEYEKGQDHQLFKHKLYGVPLRPKIKYEYSEEANKIISHLWINK